MEPFILNFLKLFQALPGEKNTSMQGMFYAYGKSSLPGNNQL